MKNKKTLGALVVSMLVALAAWANYDGVFMHKQPDLSHSKVANFSGNNQEYAAYSPANVNEYRKEQQNIVAEDGVEIYAYGAYSSVSQYV